MFFPSLTHLRNYKIDTFIIEKLDNWLAIQNKFTYNNLNPLQFALDIKINESIAVSIFALCVQKPINIMNVKYKLICPNCSELDRYIYDDLSVLNDVTLDCDNCGLPYYPLEFNEFIEVYFSLNVLPAHDPSNLIKLNESTEKILGKSESLRVSDIDRFSLRGLFDSYGSTAI
ncbi:DUF5939 domain-containing protein [Paenibacillus elgii]|uniref:DUF5939 domain-containing protein n=1 Tax=Paenibacillus elgii TaxID=189691 RepID=UPI000FDB56FA|nr:DUF5939 domain-containing protein [Paenibacillus elgii]NEN82797.1 hypothetical protein [Paenibacillus elgii]